MSVWVRLEVRGNLDPAIRRAGLWAWQAFEALIRIAKEEGAGGLVPESRADGAEIAFWCSLPDHAPELAAARDRLVAEGLVERTRAGLQIRNWSRYQIDGTGAERQRRWREKQATEEPSSPSRSVTGSNGHAPSLTPETGGDACNDDGTGRDGTLQDIPPKPPEAPQAGGADLAPVGGGQDDPDPEALPLEQRVLLALQHGDVDPVHACARKVADRHADLIRGIGLSPPRWNAAGPCYVRAVVWLSQDLRVEGWAEESVEEAGYRIVTALRAAAKRDFGPGCGGEIHAFRVLLGSSERNVAERVGALLTLLPRTCTDRRPKAAEEAA